MEVLTRQGFGLVLMESQSRQGGADRPPAQQHGNYVFTLPVALLIAASSEVSCSGFERNAAAPADSQRSRAPASLWAVMTMVGIWTPERVRWR